MYSVQSKISLHHDYSLGSYSSATKKKCRCRDQDADLIKKLCQGVTLHSGNRFLSFILITCY